MNFYSNIEKQRIIFEAYENPKFKIKNDEDFKKTDKTLFEHSNVCVDDIKLNFLFDEKNTLKKVEYCAKGCSIFLSSVELMIQQILNKNKLEINEILNEYKTMIDTSTISQRGGEILGKLVVYQNVRVHLNRLECTSIIFRLIKKAVSNE